MANVDTRNKTIEDSLSVVPWPIDCSTIEFISATAVECHLNAEPTPVSEWAGHSSRK